MAETAPAITVINLTPIGIECYVCDGEDASGFGIPIYEDLIVPDDYAGEWGGVPVCRRCFYLVRGVQSEHPGKAIRTASVRALAARAGGNHV